MIMGSFETSFKMAKNGFVKIFFEPICTNSSEFWKKKKNTWKASYEHITEAFLFIT